MIRIGFWGVRCSIVIKRNPTVGNFQAPGFRGSKELVSRGISANHN